MTFIHQFTRQIRCTVTAPDEPPPRGSISTLDFQWTERRLKKKHVRQYIQWILEVNRICADRWQTRVMYCVQITATTAQMWLFEPGKAPKRIDEEIKEAFL
jgi:hypothetical protein